MTKAYIFGFLGIASLPVPGCYTSGDLLQPISDESSLQTSPSTYTSDSPTSGGGGPSCSSGCGNCTAESLRLPGTWAVVNHGRGEAGVVTFKSDGSYTVDSGTYNAGGTIKGDTSGTYKIFPGCAIGFRYGTSPTFNRIAVVRTASANQIVHFLMATSHEYEELKRMP